MDVGQLRLYVSDRKSADVNSSRGFVNPPVRCLLFSSLLGLSKKAHDEKGQTFSGVFALGGDPRSHLFGRVSATKERYAGSCT